MDWNRRIKIATPKFQSMLREKKNWLATGEEVCTGYLLAIRGSITGFRVRKYSWAHSLLRTGCLGVNVLQVGGHFENVLKQEVRNYQCVVHY